VSNKAVAISVTDLDSGEEKALGFEMNTDHSPKGETAGKLRMLFRAAEYELGITWEEDRPLMILQEVSPAKLETNTNEETPS
jgi:hypothetical protein